MLELDNKTSNYIRSFGSVKLPAVESVQGLAFNEKVRAIRKIQCFWAILHKAGFSADEARLRSKGLIAKDSKNFSPGFGTGLRDAAFQAAGIQQTPSHPSNLDELVRELEVVGDFRRNNPNSPLLTTVSGSKLFDADDQALLEFLSPSSGSGPIILRSYQIYHAPNAGDFVSEIVNLIDQGRTVILDLGNATDTIRRYFADMLSKAVFANQETKFVNSSLANHFVQLYFEEAHNLFPPDSKDLTGIYARFAKEGAKFHIGMVYSTQSTSTINKELLAQTENFFVGHLSSQDETKSLSRVQVAFHGVEEDIMRSKTPGFMRMLTMSHRFIIPLQALKFEANIQP
jgi:DNA helicase HerA-like ATPase